MKAIKLLTGVFISTSVSGQLLPFAECDKVLEPVTGDSAALTLIKDMHEAKTHKFSSQCLEIVLRKNFMETADYLLSEYYPNT